MGNGVIRVHRIRQMPDKTFGVMEVDDIPRFVTLEPPWKFNKKQTSSIPLGEYPFELYFSKRFSRNVLLLKDVPGRDFIEIHPGNLPKDTTGCILVGLSYTGEGIFESKKAHEQLLRLVPRNGVVLIDGLPSPK